MATKPTDSVEFSTGGGALVSEPTLGKKQEGWVPNKRLPARWLNWIMRAYYRWISYFDESVDDLNTDVSTLKHFAAQLGPTNFFVKSTGVTDDITDIIQLSSTEFLACTDAGGIIKSVDGGETWSAKTSQFSSTPIRGFVKGSGANVIAFGDSSKISFSTDSGNTWTAKTTVFANTMSFLRGVFYDGTYYLAADNGFVPHSTDGDTWVEDNQSLGTTFWVGDLNDYQVFLGSAGKYNYASGQGGVANVAATIAGTPGDLKAAAYGGPSGSEVYIIVTSTGKILSRAASTAPINSWTVRDTGLGNFVGVIWSSRFELFFAWSSSGLYSSPDGITWTLRENSGSYTKFEDNAPAFSPNAMAIFGSNIADYYAPLSGNWFRSVYLPINSSTDAARTLKACSDGRFVIGANSGKIMFSLAMPLGVE